MPFTSVQGALCFLKSLGKEQRDRTPLSHPSCPTLPAPPCLPLLFSFSWSFDTRLARNWCKFSTLRQTGLWNKLDHIIAFGQHLFGVEIMMKLLTETAKPSTPPQSHLSLLLHVCWPWFSTLNLSLCIITLELWPFFYAIKSRKIMAPG